MENKPKKSLLFRALANLAAFAAGCALVVLVLGAAEGTLRIKAHFKKQPKDSLEFGNLHQHVNQKTLGFKPLPSIVMKDSVLRGERRVYEAEYTIDGNSRRMTPCDSPETRDSVAAFFGCSFTFGRGVQDDETFPARFAAHCPAYLPLNYGYNGYGPQQAWLLLNRLGALNELPSKKGAVVFTFIDNHLDRLVGATSILSVWGYPMPWLTIENGAIHWAGTFNDRMTIQSLWARYAEQTHLVKFVENHMPRRSHPPENTAGAVTLFATVMEECGRAVAKAGPELKFYCLIFPGTPPPCSTAVADALRGRKGVVLLDYSRLLDGAPYTDDKLWYDDSPWAPWGHPRALAYDLVAARLARDIGGCD
jgi:hypothetical protein